MLQVAETVSSPSTASIDSGRSGPAWWAISS